MGSADSPAQQYTHFLKSLDANMPDNKFELPVIWVLGGPGCGRGTQCELIQTRTGYTHISTGEVLRHEVMSGSQRGLKFYKIMADGEAVPDDEVAELIRETLMAKIIGSKGFLMDGFPLDQEQAISFTRLIGTPDAVIYLHVNENTMKDRLKKRGNFDDTESSIDKRVQLFLDKTTPLIKTWHAIKIDAEKPTNELFADIMAVLEKEHALKFCETVQMS